MSEVKETLTKARDLIADPKRWTHHALARDSVFRKTVPNSPDATCWCALGAIWKATGDVEADNDGAYSALHDVINGSVVNFNDTHTHAEVIELFNKAIENV